MPKPHNNGQKIGELRSALVAIERALGGKSIEDLARKFRVTEKTIKKDLDLAAESGFIDHYKALLHDGAVPQAMAVYEAHLSMGSLEAARDILFGLGVLQKQAPEATRLKTRALDTLESYRAERASKERPTHAAIQ